MSHAAGPGVGRHHAVTDTVPRGPRLTPCTLTLLSLGRKARPLSSERSCRLRARGLRAGPPGPRGLPQVVRRPGAGGRPHPAATASRTPALGTTGGSHLASSSRRPWGLRSQRGPACPPGRDEVAGRTVAHLCRRSLTPVCRSPVSAGPAARAVGPRAPTARSAGKEGWERDLGAETEPGLRPQHMGEGRPRRGRTRRPPRSCPARAWAAADTGLPKPRPREGRTSRAPDGQVLAPHERLEKPVRHRTAWLRGPFGHKRRTRPPSGRREFPGRLDGTL